MTDGRFKAQVDDESLELGCGASGQNPTSHRRRKIPTFTTFTLIGNVTEGKEGSPLSISVVTVEEVDDWVEGLAVDKWELRPSDFCICKGGSLLKVNVFGKCECRQRRQWRMKVFGTMVI